MNDIVIDNKLYLRGYSNYYAIRRSEFGPIGDIIKNMKKEKDKLTRETKRGNCDSSYHSGFCDAHYKASVTYNELLSNPDTRDLFK